MGRVLRFRKISGGDLPWSFCSPRAFVVAPAPGPSGCRPAARSTPFLALLARSLHSRRNSGLLSSGGSYHNRLNNPPPTLLLLDLRGGQLRCHIHPPGAKLILKPQQAFRNKCRPSSLTVGPFSFPCACALRGPWSRSTGNTSSAAACRCGLSARLALPVAASPVARLNRPRPCMQRACMRAWQNVWHRRAA